MSLNNIKLLYRSILKDVGNPVNRKLFSDFIRAEIKQAGRNSINNTLRDDGSKQNNNNHNIIIEKWDYLIESYLKMKYHIKKENELLSSYNINIVRDSKKEIEGVAKRVGLQI